jgi:hypothetical protein
MQKRAKWARVPVGLLALAGLVLASTPNGPEVGAIIGRGGEGTISDGAGRGGAVAVQTIATETPVEQQHLLQRSGRELADRSCHRTS